MQRIGITIKLTLLCAVLSTAPVVYLTFQQTTKEVQELSRDRMRACQELALNCARNLQRRNYRAIRNDLSDFSQHDSELEGVRLTRFDGLLIHDSSAGTLDWSEGIGLPTRQLQVPIIRESKKWGNLEARFKSSVRLCLAVQPVYHRTLATSITVGSGYHQDCSSTSPQYSGYNCRRSSYS